MSCAALVALASLAFPVHNKATLLRHTALLAMLKRAAAPGARSSRLRAAAVRTLAVLGQNDLVDAAVGRPPIAGRGLRVLALDGGGMKGMAEVRMLRAIEARTGRRIWELFDVIGGTSTGCMLAMGVGIMGMTLDAMEEVYMGLGKRVFSKRAAAAAVGPEAGGGAARESWAESLARMYRSGEESMRVALYGAKYSADVFEQLLREASCLTAKGCGALCVFGTARVCRVHAAGRRAQRRCRAAQVRRGRAHRRGLAARAQGVRLRHRVLRQPRAPLRLPLVRVPARRGGGGARRAPRAARRQQQAPGLAGHPRVVGGAVLPRRVWRRRPALPGRRRHRQQPCRAPLSPPTLTST